MIRSFNEKLIWGPVVLLIGAFISIMNTPANAVTPRDFGGKGDVVTLRDGAVSAGAP